MVGITDHFTLTERETALLTCVGYGQQQVEFSWMFNDQNITNSSLISIFEEAAERRIFRQSFLEICSVGMDDSGTYTCTVSNDMATDSAATHLTVSGKKSAHLFFFSNYIYLTYLCRC